MGLTYERKLAEAIERSLPQARHGQWYEFLADGKHGYCQPDIVVLLTGAVLVLECKLKNVEEAQGQLVQLYAPVLHCAYNRPVRAIIVARSLSALPPGAIVATDLLQALQLTKSGEMPVLHWLGRGPL